MTTTIPDDIGRDVAIKAKKPSSRFWLPYGKKNDQVIVRRKKAVESYLSTSQVLDNIDKHMTCPNI